MFVKVQFSGHRRSLAAGAVYPSRQVFSAEDCPHLAAHSEKINGVSDLEKLIRGCCGSLILAGNPIVDSGFQDVQRESTRAQHHVMEVTNVKAITEFAFCPLPKFQNLELSHYLIEGPFLIMKPRILRDLQHLSFDARDFTQTKLVNFLGGKDRLWC